MPVVIEETKGKQCVELKRFSCYLGFFVCGVSVVSTTALRSACSRFEAGVSVGNRRLRSPHFLRGLDPGLLSLPSFPRSLLT